MQFCFSSKFILIFILESKTNILIKKYRKRWRNFSFIPKNLILVLIKFWYDKYTMMYNYLKYISEIRKYLSLKQCLYAKHFFFIQILSEKCNLVCCFDDHVLWYDERVCTESHLISHTNGTESEIFLLYVFPCFKY